MMFITSYHRFHHQIMIWKTYVWLGVSSYHMFQKMFDSSSINVAYFQVATIRVFGGM